MTNNINSGRVNNFNLIGIYYTEATFLVVTFWKGPKMYKSGKLPSQVRIKPYKKLKTYSFNEK